MESLERLRRNIGSVYMGDEDAVDRVVVCLLAKGHVLIEDVPGVGKTVLAHALARSIDCDFARLQMTPDMLPADVLGVTVWRGDEERFEFKAGPIFSNILLADEINRTTPRTQSALLEAMNEAQVSIDGQTREIEAPFMVVATQNPFEFEGTYFLPESQLDRFLMRIHLGYPSAADEGRILTEQPSRTVLADLEAVMSREELLGLQGKVNEVRMDEALVDYIVRIGRATRKHEMVHVGVSPRGSLALTQVAKATAVLRGRDYVVPDDIVENVLPVCTHRVVTKNWMHNGHGEHSAKKVLEGIMEGVGAPV